MNYDEIIGRIYDNGDIQGIIMYLLVFHRKDLCDARPKPDISSKKADVSP